MHCLVVCWPRGIVFLAEDTPVVSKAQWRVNSGPAGKVNGEESLSCQLGMESHRSDGKMNMTWSTSLLASLDVQTADGREAVHGRGVGVLEKKQHNLVEDRTLASTHQIAV
jgi:hypothetical protein